MKKHKPQTLAQAKNLINIVFRGLAIAILAAYNNKLTDNL